MQNFVETNCEDVGEHFAREAISIHLGDSEPHNIYGTATDAEEQELTELGVDYTKLRLPRFDD